MPQVSADEVRGFAEAVAANSCVDPGKSKIARRSKRPAKAISRKVGEVPADQRAVLRGLVHINHGNDLNPARPNSHHNKALASGQVFMRKGVNRRLRKGRRRYLSSWDRSHSTIVVVMCSDGSPGVRPMWWPLA